MRHICDLSNRHYLADPVDHMSKVQEFCIWCDGFPKFIDNEFIIFHWKFEAYLFILDAFAIASLFPCIDHIWIILSRANHFVACF